MDKTVTVSMVGERDAEEVPIAVEGDLALIRAGHLSIFNRRGCAIIHVPTGKSVVDIDRERGMRILGAASSAVDWKNLDFEDDAACLKAKQVVTKLMYAARESR